METRQLFNPCWQCPTDGRQPSAEELLAMILGNGSSFTMSPLNDFTFLGEFHPVLVIYLHLV